MLRRHPSLRRGGSSTVGGGGSVPDNSILLQNGLDWLTTEAGEELLLGDVTVVEPTINGSQTFSVATNAPNGTVIGTVAVSGSVSPTGFSIDGTGISISSTGVLTKTGSLSVGSTTRNVTCSRSTSGYTSPAVSIGVTVTSKSYTAESGDNIAIAAVAWATGAAVTAGVRRSNAGKLYEATTSGTTGATAPTHASGEVSDGTVSWLFLCTIDYTSFSSWAASITGTLSAPRTGIVWMTSEIATAGGNAPIELDFSGVTTTAGNRITLKVKEEDAWYANASPAMRYDATRGVAVRAGQYRRAIHLNAPAQHVTVQGFQFIGTSANSHPSVARSLDANTLFKRCVFEATGDIDMVWLAGTITNCAFIKNSAGTNRAVLLWYAAAALLDCTIARPSNHAAGGVAVAAQYSTPTMINCIAAGFTDAPVGSFSNAHHNAATNTTSIPGTSKVTIASMATEFVQPSSAGGAHDFRLLAGASSRNGGSTAPTGAETVDAFGTTRTVPWDIGAHEYA